MMLDLIMYIIRLRLTVPLSRTTEWMARRVVWCSLWSVCSCVVGVVYGDGVKGVELDRTLGVTVEAMLSEEAAHRGRRVRKRERKRTKAVTTIIFWLLRHIQPTKVLKLGWEVV